MTLAQRLPVPGLVWGSYPEARSPGRGLAWRLTQAETAESFALIDAACERALGFKAYGTQLAAARLMLAGRIVEMATGEGKTVAALFAAAAAARAGVPVHVVTANDYLAARDAEALRNVYAGLGLTVAAVRQGMSAEERRKAYACDVTYCSAKELVFDYLRDSLVRRARGGELELRAARLAGARAAPPLVLRGLCMAVVDEADSILIDEARVPLVLSHARENAPERAFHAHALGLARTLEGSRDYRLDPERRGVQLTPEGRGRVSSATAEASALERHAAHREEAVVLALTALHLVHKDRDYLVRDGRVVLVEPTTGRAAHGRAWSRGLHQLVEIKEGLAPSARAETLAQITYQRFFPRYLRLCGMSATVSEARMELYRVYGCRVAPVAPRKPSRRQVLPGRFFATQEERWTALVERAAHLHAAGRPVLIGTASVAASEALSRHLAAARLSHTVLNARHDEHEAAVVRAAGAPGAITVATNMAGRGTDIALGEGVAERGGLHVILCQHNASRRIDRQFLGRCARRGEPGSCETLLALDDLSEGLAARLLRRFYRPRSTPHWIAFFVARLAGWQQELRHRAERRRLCAADALAERTLPLHRPRSLRKPSHAD